MVCIISSLSRKSLKYSLIKLYAIHFMVVKMKTGFKVTKKGCCGTGYLETGFMCNVISKTCPNHSDHLFWDSIHPSEAAYKYLGNFVDAQIRGWLKT